MLSCRLGLPGALLIAGAVLALAEALIYAMGHPIFCPCGTVKLWYGIKDGPEQWQQFADWYTYTHVVRGILWYWLVSAIAKGRLSLAARFVLAALLEGGAEVLANTPALIDRHRTHGAAQAHWDATLVHVAGDFLAMMLGFFLAARLPVWFSVALLIGSELTLFVLIGDNFTLALIAAMRST